MTTATLPTRGNLKPAIIAGTIVLALNLGFYGFVVRPRIVSFRDLEGSKETINKELSTAEKTEKTLSDYYDRLNATKANTDDFYKKVLGTKQDNMIAVQRELI